MLACKHCCESSKLEGSSAHTHQHPPSRTSDVWRRMHVYAEQVLLLDGIAAVGHKLRSLRIPAARGCQLVRRYPLQWLAIVALLLWLGWGMLSRRPASRNS